MAKGEEFEVEKSLLTPEFKSFAKNVKALHRVEQMIKQGLQMKQSEMQQLQQMAQEVQGKKQTLMQMQPDVVNELPGQEKGREKRFRHTIGN